MIGIYQDQMRYIPIAKAVKIDKPNDRELINVQDTLSI